MEKDINIFAYIRHVLCVTQQEMGRILNIPHSKIKVAEASNSDKSIISAYIAGLSLVLALYGNREIILRKTQETEIVRLLNVLKALPE